ncbi:MAG: pilus assembly protein PilM [Candidatus Omnitrophica bacterium]|nr:pilus assembly protein PilM [Candidatus Omnitrophota bacterium]
MKIKFLEKFNEYFKSKLSLNKWRFGFNRDLIRKPIVVVEIGNDWLKIVENDFFLSGRSITKINLIKLNQIKDSVSVSLAKIFAELKLDKSSVITYLSRYLVTIRVLEFPSTNPQEINDMVNLQVGKQTPYSKEEIISAHKILSENSKEGCSKVMLVIARRKLISDRMEALTAAGLDVERIGVSSQGIYNWVKTAIVSESKIDSAPTVLVDIDSNFSDFLVISKNELVFTRNILIGANHLIEEIPRWREKFLSELQYSMDLYQSEDSGNPVSRLFFSGAAKGIEGLDGLVSSKLNIPVEVIDPVKNLRLSKDCDILGQDQYKFVSISSLIGTAINHKDFSFDLTPVEWRLKKMMENKRK